jgi:hypothetical protein
MKRYGRRLRDDGLGSPTPAGWQKASRARENEHGKLEVSRALLDAAEETEEVEKKEDE